MKLCVLQPGSSEPDQQFPAYAGAPDPKLPPPLGYRGLAACTGGGVYRNDSSIPSDERRVLLVLNRNLKACRQTVINLRRAGKTIVLALEKTGAFDVNQWLRSPGDLSVLREICVRAHAGLAITADVEPVLRAGGLLYVETIPQPIPVEAPEWDFSQPAENRHGILLGTWDWKTPHKRHLEALIALRDVSGQMYEPVTVFNLDGWRGRRWLRQLEYPAGLLRVIERRLPYVEYLEKMASHKMVFQLDASGGPGRVAADALLCRIPCVGGTGATERIVFPELCGHGVNTPDLGLTASRLLDHSHDRELAVESALNFAAQRISFNAIQQSLEQLFHCFG